MKATTDFAQMGIAALLPGMQYAVDQMQKVLNDMREALGAPQNGRPPAKGKQGGWEKMTSAQRSLEMKRRELARDKKAKRPGAGGASHSLTQKAYWAGMTAAERSAEMKRRLAKRKAA